MREQIFIRIDPAQADGASWLCQTGTNPEQYADLMRGPLQDAAAFTHGKRVIVLLPATWVTFAAVNVPSRSRQHIAAAIPNLLEDQLASDIDVLHFALGKRESDGRINVAMIDRELLQSCLNRLSQAGIHPHVVVPESLALPYDAGTWTLLVEQDTVILRTAQQNGLAIDRENLPFLLPRAIDEAGTLAPSQLLVLTCEGVDLGDAFVPELPLAARLEQTGEPALKVFARHFNEQDTINLLQGSFSIRDKLGKLWRPWRAAGLMLACWIVIQLGITAVKQYELDRENKALKDEIGKIYLRTFPEAQKIVNAKVQMERGLEALRTGGGSGSTAKFIEILAELSAPLAETQGLTVQRLSYKEGELSLALLIGDLQRLEQLKQRLTSTGHTVEILSANNTGNQVEARLLIKKGKP